MCPEGHQAADVGVNGAGIAGLILAARITQCTDLSVAVFERTKKIHDDYGIVLDRSDLVRLSNIFAIPIDTFIDIGRTVPHSYLRWGSPAYEVVDHFFSTENRRIVTNKKTLIAVLRDACLKLNIDVQQINPFKKDGGQEFFANGTDENSEKGFVVNACGRSAHHRSSDVGLTDGPKTSPYIRYICTSSGYRNDNFYRAHILESVPTGWFSILPVTEFEFELVASAREFSTEIKRNPSEFLITLTKYSPLLERITSSDDFEIRRCAFSFTCLSNNASLFDGKAFDIGDALFPIDPLSGQGLKFAIWSAHLAVDRIESECPISGTANFNNEVRSFLARYREQRDYIYRSSRWCM